MNGECLCFRLDLFLRTQNEIDSETEHEICAISVFDVEHCASCISSWQKEYRCWMCFKSKQHCGNKKTFALPNTHVNASAEKLYSFSNIRSEDFYPRLNLRKAGQFVEFHSRVQ